MLFSRIMKASKFTSRNLKMLSKNVATANKPCKVCQDAGKRESECTNHRLKDINGNVTCPTLLKTECRYCFKLGHTIKYCSVLAKNTKDKEKVERRFHTIIAEKPKPVVQKKPQNGFAALCDDSDSEEEVSNTNTNTIVNEYPEMQSKKKVDVESKPEVKTGWAAIAAKPAVVKKPVEPAKPTGLVMLSDYIKPQVEQPKAAPWAASKQVVKKSWADESDSEDDEDSLPEVNFKQEVEDDTW